MGQFLTSLLIQSGTQLLEESLLKETESHTGTHQNLLLESSSLLNTFT